MAKLEKCKTCGKDVASNAKVCPHCGQKNPTVNMLHGFIAFMLIWGGLTYWFVNMDAPEQKEIQKSQYGGKWAFKSDTATLQCYTEGSDKLPVVVVDGKPYGLTGYADMLHGQNNLDAFNNVWLDDPTIEGMKISTSIFEKEALQLCD